MLYLLHYLLTVNVYVKPHPDGSRWIVLEATGWTSFWWDWRHYGWKIALGNLWWIWKHRQHPRADQDAWRFER